MRIGSLCSGYGGLDMGVQSVLGGETVWVSDVCKFSKDKPPGHFEPHRGACKILAHRYPNVPNLGDFTQTDWSTVEPIDVLTAGFPCQPVSNAGKQRGDEDERWLWDDVARAVRELRPGIVVLENVRGLLTAGSGRLFARVLGTLADLGYDAQWHGLLAAETGAPHNRFRVFIVARDTYSKGLEGRGAGERADQRPLGAPSVGSRLTLLPTPAVNDMGAGKTVEAWDAWTARMKAKHGNGNGHGKSLAIEAQRLLPTPRATRGGSGTETMYAIGGERTDTERPQGTVVLRHGAQWGAYAAAIERWESALGRTAPAPTMATAKGNPQLSPAFVEWMMGLPAGWVTEVPDMTRTEALKALGNGVVPQQAAAALRTMLTWAEVAA